MVFLNQQNDNADLICDSDYYYDMFFVCKIECIKCKTQNIINESMKNCKKQ